jgi:hypothetical protein
MNKEILIDEYKALENEIHELQLLRKLIKSNDNDTEKLEKIHEKITNLIYEQAKIMKDDSYEIR